ncbi:MAG: sulfite exporter TauE/SafE family protein [Rubrobacter sp.]|nr:sulfite exporter TauE/SafE family protein [Rubrobacter sp.]
MHFLGSGVDVNPLIPLLVAFLVSALTAPAGVSGAFLLLPFQVSVLGFTSPAVSPTNLIYNVIAAPGGVYRYVREQRVIWPLVAVVILGALPGVFVGAVVRITYLSDLGSFKVFVGFVLLYLGTRLLYEVGTRIRSGPWGSIPLDSDVTMEWVSASMCQVEYHFGGKRYTFSIPAVFVLSLVVGIIGGIYSVGGGSIIAPFLVTVFGLPVYTVAGATMISTFATSVGGVAFYELLATTSLGSQAAVAPDWLLGLVLGVGGFIGTYVGARLQRFLPDFWIRATLGVLVTILAFSYIVL